MLALGVMQALRRARSATFVAIASSFFAFQCGREDFDLLATEQVGASTGGAGPTGGAMSTGGTPGTAGAFQGDGGERSPGSPDPFEPPTCREDEDCNPNWGFCNEGRCAVCKVSENGASIGCRVDQKCDRFLCRATCETTGVCRDAICDEEFGRFTCVQCVDDRHCNRRCRLGACVECVADDDCPRGEVCNYYGFCT